MLYLKDSLQRKGCSCMDQELLISKFKELPLNRTSSRYSSRKFPLHALTVLSGHERKTSSDYRCEGEALNTPSYVVWQYTLSGRGAFQNKKGSIDLLPGTLMIVSVPSAHVYYLPEDSDHWEFVFLVMIGREALRITHMIESNLGNCLDMRGHKKTVLALFDICQALATKNINNPFSNSGQTYALSMSLLEELGDHPRPTSNQPFQELRTYLKEQIARDISVQEMADFCNLSRSHFSRLFSEQMGISPRVYLEDLRLKTAMGILYNERASVKETAIRCGITDVNYFCRLFKKRFGVSPGKYKEGEG
jgi:AraC-like DNA-binding protein